MGTNTLTNRIDGQVISQSFFNEIHQAIRETFVPRNSSNVATDAGADMGSTTYRWNDGYFVSLIIGAIASGISIEDDSGDLVLKRNSVEVGRFTVNGLSGADLIDATITLSKMAANSVDTSQIVSAAVTLAKMASNSVGTSQIVNLAVTSDKINTSAVQTAKINNLAVTTEKINTEAVTLAKLADVSVTVAAFSTTSVSPSNTTQISSLTFQPSVTQRPVVMRFNGSNTTNSGITLSSATNCSVNLIFKVGGTQVCNQRLGGTATTFYIPFATVDFYDYNVTASSQTYSVEVATDSATTWTTTGGQFEVFQI